METFKLIVASLLSPLLICLICQTLGWLLWLRRKSRYSIWLIFSGTCFLLIGGLSGLTHEQRRSLEYTHPPLDIANDLRSDKPVLAVVLGTGFNSDPELPANCQVSSTFHARLLEGWQYNIAPAAFEWQLQEIARRGFRYVAFEEYLAEVGKGRRNSWRLATVTFDDGWRDNFDYALPILQAHSIPATFFIVSGEMDGVARDRRMTHDQLCRLKSKGMTIGAHTRTHPNLAVLGSTSLADELRGSREDLEAILGNSVMYLAYPGGRFNRNVVTAAQQAGFEAACSVIGWGQNSEASRYWLYRDVFSDRLDSISDRLRLHAWSRRMLGWKASRTLGRMLQVRIHG